MFRTLVIAAVRVVLPWSMWPMVPMLTWGLVRLNTCFAILISSSIISNRFFLWTILYQVRGSAPVTDKFFLERLGQLNEVAGLHAVIRAALRLAAQVRSVTEHRGQRNVRAYYRGAVADVRAGDLAATGVYVAHYVAHILLRRR